MGLRLEDEEIPLIKMSGESMINFLLIKKMMLKIQHQGIPGRSLEIIHSSSNGNLPRPCLNFQFSLLQSICSFTLNTNDLGSNSLALTETHFDVLFISLAGITMF